MHSQLFFCYANRIIKRTLCSVWQKLVAVGKCRSATSIRRNILGFLDVMWHVGNFRNKLDLLYGNFQMYLHTLNWLETFK